MGLSFRSHPCEPLRKTLHVVVISKLCPLLASSSFYDIVLKKKKKLRKNDNKRDRLLHGVALVDEVKTLVVVAACGARLAPGPSVCIHWRNEPRQPAVINISTAHHNPHTSKEYNECVRRSHLTLLSLLYCFLFFFSLPSPFSLPPPFVCGGNIFGRDRAGHNGSMNSMIAAIHLVICFQSKQQKQSSRSHSSPARVLPSSSLNNKLGETRKTTKFTAKSCFSM